jgi:cytochrome c oxidase assembly protein subunit 15
MVQKKADRAVAIFIGIGIVMLIVQVLLGGITRLTGSGLSITEWDVITGTIPPTSAAAWQAEFEKYKTTPQYNLLNTHFTLSDFTFIYFWEWFHRFWARMIGVVFVVGFIYLLLKRHLHKRLQKPLLLLFLLGALQGLVGWIMVKSGLSGDEVYVKPTRLALHFIFAIGLIAYAHWFYLQLTISPAERKNIPLAIRFTWILLSILIIQLIFGALMAGHKAATAAPTWPDINGDLVPAFIWDSGGIKNLISDKITVHFVHRTTGYFLLLGLFMFASYLRRYTDELKMLRRYYLLPEFLGLFQVALGILTLFTSPRIVPNSWGLFETLALLHQLTALLLVLSLITILFLVRVKSYPPSS